MTTRKIPTVLLVLVTVTACGGSTGETASVPQLEDLTGTELAAAAASYQPGQGASVTDGANITLDEGFLTGSALNGSLEISGETVAITDGSGKLGDQDVTLIFEPERSGKYAGAVEIVVFDGGELTGETHYVFGTETNAGNLPSGSATYTGGFQALGQIGGGDANYEGGATFVADFNGNVDGTLDGMLNGETPVELSLDAAPVSGNGFSGELICSAGCTTSSSTVDATFYGPSAEELGGVLALQFDEFEGVGTFIIAIE
ncbi:transferrin-binding protein-like solute binding protein [Yoonia maritima]|uniref:transferrin-binding protein-like solute binding protein n=1 Tax=Yoonia maritima TaxID=1435347 RepID=UPI00373696DD